MILLITFSLFLNGSISHSCETPLLRVYIDIVTTIGNGDGVILVLLDLTADFDTIDHYNRFCILDKYVSILSKCSITDYVILFSSYSRRSN